MTHLWAFVALRWNWIHKNTPESCIVPAHSISLRVSLQVNFSLAYHVATHLHWLQYSSKWDSADMLKMSMWMGRHAYNIALLTAIFAAAFWYGRLSCKYMYSGSRYITYGDSQFSVINMILRMTRCNALPTRQVRHILTALPIQCLVVVSNAWIFMSNYYL